jgi:hypothetical protein
MGVDEWFDDAERKRLTLEMWISEAKAEVGEATGTWDYEEGRLEALIRTWNLIFRPMFGDPREAKPAK